MPGIRAHADFTEWAAFAQDEWRIAPRFTLNLGIRYDLQVIAKRAVKNPWPALASHGLDTSFVPVDPNNVQPRVGFAWTPLPSSKRLLVRGGYGIFYGITPSLMTGRAFFQNGVTAVTDTFRAGSSGAAIIPAYPNTLCGPPDPSGVPPSCPAPDVPGGNPTLVFFSPHYVQPYTQQGSLVIEVEPRSEMAVSVSYLWVKGTHLQRTQDVNLLASAPEEIGIAGTTTMFTYEKFQNQRLIDGFDRIWNFESTANSTYHGLVLQLNKRWAHNFQLLGSYTFGKVIDDVPDHLVVNPGPDDFAQVSDSTNPRVDRGPGANDQRHRLVISGIWRPNYARQRPRVTRTILGGWELSGIFTAQSGHPYSGLLNFDLNHDGNPATDRTPRLGRDTFCLPAIISLDPRVTRNMPLNERVKLQLIWEAFNVLNHTNVTGVRTTQFSLSTAVGVCRMAGAPCLVPQNTGLSAFGTPTATSGPRIMQLSAKIAF